MLLLILLMMLYCLQQIGFYSYKRRVKSHSLVDICSFQERVGKPFIRFIKDNISSRFRSSSKDVLSAFSVLIQRKFPASLLMSYIYMETVQFKLSLDSLEEIYQLNHWKELNLRRQPLSLLISAQSGKRIVSSLLSIQKMIYPCN